MNLQCLLALTACIHTQGTLIPSEKAVSLLDTCQVIKQFSVTDFEEPKTLDDRGAWGNGTSDFLDANGLPIKPGYTPAERMSNARNACNSLERDFNNNEMWEIPPKRRPVFWINLLGTVLEALGALVLGRAAYQYRGATSKLGKFSDSNSMANAVHLALSRTRSDRQGMYLIGIGIFLHILVAAGV